MNVLDDEQVVRKLRWDDVLTALEDGFRLRAEFQMPTRLALSAPAGGSYLVMPCADAEGWFGVKQVSAMPHNEARGLPTVQAHYTLFGPTGTPLLACAATFLTRIRTAGVSALAAKSLAPPQAATLLVIGTGSLAPWLAEAHAQVRDYRDVIVWGRDHEKASATVKTIQSRLHVPVRAVKELDEAVVAADVITAATTARTPLVRGEKLRPGQHLDLVGAFLPEMCETDALAVKRAEVFVDDLEACKAEAGDLIQACRAGWSFNEVKGDLAALVSGKIGREKDEAITLFKSVGLALEDLVVAKLLA